MNYTTFKQQKNAERSKRFGPEVDGPNYFKGTISPLPSTLSDGGKVI